DDAPDALLEGLRAAGDVHPGVAGALLAEEEAARQGDLPLRGEDLRRVVAELGVAAEVDPSEVAGSRRIVDRLRQVFGDELAEQETVLLEALGDLARIIAGVIQRGEGDVDRQMPGV